MSRPGDKGVTLYDVARAAGVSAMTVSRVVNERNRVSPATRKAVKDSIRELGYAPNIPARTLARSQFDRLALLHGDPRAFAISRLLIGAVEESGQLGVEIVPHRVESEKTNPRSTVSRLLNKSIGGVLLMPPLGDCARLVEALHAAGLPVVVMAAGRAPAHTLSIGIDDYGAACEMTQHLLSLGHRRIGFIRGHPSQSASEERWRGFVAALSNAGIDTDQTHVEQGFGTYRSGLDAAGRLLSSSPAPTAIFASNDDMAAGAITAANRRGLPVPRALTVVGFDDNPIACTVWPELTTVHLPATQIGAEAVRMLLRAIRSGHAETQAESSRELVGHRLVVRASAAAPVLSV